MMILLPITLGHENKSIYHLTAENYRFLSQESSQNPTSALLLLLSAHTLNQLSNLVATRRL